MQIARTAIERPLYTWLFMLFCLLGGVFGYTFVGKLEDPTFTLKSALVITAYPGAAASDVATEVSEKLEAEIQRMDEVKTITSRNSPGLSVIEVEMRDQFDGGDLPQIWDDLRDRVADAQAALPEGAETSIVNDDFGDVFGILYAVTAEGYSDGEIWEIATYLRREVLAVDGVANAELRGLPEEAIYIEPDSTILGNLGLDPNRIIQSISGADAVVPTGTAPSGDRNLSIEAPSGDDSVGEIAGLSLGTEGGVINLLDIAEIRRDRVEDPSQIMRHDGMPAFTLGIAGLQSRNIVAVDQAVEARLAEVAPILPLGVELHPIYEQHRVVDEANAGFIESLAISVGVVIAVLALFMGWRAALVVGGSLFLTVTATFFFMFLWDVKVERISLGALIIAMGMLVDNAIVVAEGMQTAMRRGRTAIDAAAEVAGKVQIPLLGATIIGIMAFAGIGLSPDASGEFLFTLFAVIAISLTLSWIIAVTVTPLLASYVFRTAAEGVEDDVYGGLGFRAYGWFVGWALKLRWLVIVALIGITVVGFGAMGLVKQQFFPPANTPIFYLNYKAAQGSSIHETSRDLAVIEDWLAERDDVVSVSASIGQAFTRFILTYNPTDRDPSKGQLVIRAESFDAIPALRADLDSFAADAVPWAEIRSELIIYGPPVTADIEARFTGPDPDVLRALAEEAKAVLETSTSLLHTERIDWREREFVTRPVLAEDRAQAVGITRQDVATTIALATDGVPAGSYRERDRLIPIILRTPRDEVADGDLRDRLVWSPALQDFLPLGQVVDGFTVLARDTLIERRNRVPTVSVQAFTIADVTPPTAFAQVRPLIEAIELPPGYALEWGGEFESAGEAQASLGKQMPLSFGIMLLITILLFGKLRQTAVIWTIVPMAVNGVSLGLLFSGQAFSFTALLGLLSLSGMLIKNAIVLVEEIDDQKAQGLPQSDAIVTASVSRLRPVVLAAGTTILGMAPLLFDAFFAAMAVTIMAGLGFATILTLVGVPVFYQTYLRRERRADKRAAKEKAAPQPDPIRTTRKRVSPFPRRKTAHAAE
ncbi:MAG: efflux RND transporter permease subunit [Pseudomonadota bacterium]